MSEKKKYRSFTPEQKAEHDVQQVARRETCKCVRAGSAVHGER